MIGSFFFNLPTELKETNTPYEKREWRERENSGGKERKKDEVTEKR